jgi:hypothetical protein
MSAHGIKGALAVGVPSALLEASFLNAFPLGVYGFHAGLLSGAVGPAALNWALIRGLTETGTTLMRYTPEADFNGSDSFTYRTSDGFATSGVATVTINVAPTSDAPVAYCQW